MASPGASSVAGTVAGKDGKPRSTWETEKKRRRRVEILEKRLEEKAQEMEAYQGQATQAKELLARTLKEKEGMQKRLGAALKEHGHVKDTVVGEMRRADSDKARIFQLEEEVSPWTLGWDGVCGERAALLTPGCRRGWGGGLSLANGV